VARRRFFVDTIRAGTAELHGEDARHLTRVLRAEAGQRYEISDNQSAYLAEIAESRGDRVVFRIIEPIESVSLPLLLTLCVALIKFDRFEWMLEKATELGVDRVLPIESARCEKGLLDASRKRAERWTRVARESSQQSRRVRSPEILPAVKFDRGLVIDADHRYFLEETTAPPLLQRLPDHRVPSDNVALLVGPEGGWIDSERQAAATAGWKAASLGPLILRAETAAIAAIAVLANAWLTR